MLEIKDVLVAVTSARAALKNQRFALKFFPQAHRDRFHIHFFYLLVLLKVQLT